MKVLVGIAIALTLGNLVHLYLWKVHDETLRDFTWRFDMSGDTTVPTWWASFTLLISSVLFHLVGRLKTRDGAPFARHWHGLAAIFLLLSIDETAALHEASGSALEVSTTGFFYYSWVLLGLGAVAVFAVAYWRFFWNLPVALRSGLFIAAALYVGGALGIEMINARTEFVGGAESTRYQLGTAVEEFFEMAGVLWLIHVLLGQLSTMTPSVTIGRSSASTPQHEPI